MSKKPTLIAADLEGVFLPEIWIAVAEKSGIEKLRLTTRDIPDYDQLMRGRLEILRENGLTLKDIQDVIDTLEPLPGAIDFVNWAKTQAPLIVLSDTFYEFAAPLMAKLGNPTLFCNSLSVDANNHIVDYHIRKKDGKREAVLAFRALNFRIIAMGDSYNDTTMLVEADHGILFRPPDNVIAEFPQFPVMREYGPLKQHLTELLKTEA